MQGAQLWLCILLGLLCLTTAAAARREERDSDSVASHARAEAEAASYLSKEDTDGGDAAAVAARESEIHPFRVAKRAAQPIALEKTESSKPELMRYFEKAQAASKNAGRRHQEMKMKASAQKRLLRQQAEQEQAAPEQQPEETTATVTPIPVEEPAVAVEESAQTVVVPAHPHLLAFYLEQLADQAAEQAQNVDNGVLAAQDALVLLDEDQVASTAADAAAAAAAATGPAANTGAGSPSTPTDTAAAPAADTAAAAGTGAATPPATTADAGTAAGGGGGAATGGVADTTSPPSDTPSTDTGVAASTGADAVTNSVVPLSHLEQLQKDLSAVEAEHAARQAELNAELKKQQDQTRQLLEQERQGTVGLTVTPILVNPEKHLPIDPNNSELYNNAPTDPKMNIKPSVFRKANDLVAAAQGQHTEFVHNMPIECAQPTCIMDQ